jgi:universal stress protein A
MRPVASCQKQTTINIMKIKPSQKPGRVLVELEAKDERLLESGDNDAATAFKLKKILVPIDFSECSQKALQYALSFARQFKASLVLVHVVNINFGYGEIAAIDYPTLEKQIREGSEKQLATLAQQEIGESIPAEIHVCAGAAAREIVEAARNLDCDLIIISTHGHTGLKHVLLGSTSESVVRHAPCPVLVVRQHEHEFITHRN